MSNMTLTQLDLIGAAAWPGDRASVFGCYDHSPPVISL